MKKLVYEVGTKKTCSYAEALEYAKALGEIVKTLFEEVEEPVHMTDKQRAARPRVQLLERQVSAIMGDEEKLKIGDVFWELNNIHSEPFIYPRYILTEVHIEYVKKRLGKFCFLTEEDAKKAMLELGARETQPFPYCPVGLRRRASRIPNYTTCCRFCQAKFFRHFAQNFSQNGLNFVLYKYKKICYNKLYQLGSNKISKKYF